MNKHINENAQNFHVAIKTKSNEIPEHFSQIVKNKKLIKTFKCIIIF